LLEIRFEAVAARPGDALVELCHFVGLPAPTWWLDRAASCVDRARLRPAEGVEMGEGPAALLRELGYIRPSITPS
jgi:hypothetical protein